MPEYQKKHLRSSRNSVQKILMMYMCLLFIRIRLMRKYFVMPLQNVKMYMFVNNWERYSHYTLV